jgi:hypothetical protein
MTPCHQDKREVLVLIVLFAIPVLVFWVVTIEAAMALSRFATLVALSGALTCTLGYVGLVWRAKARRGGLRPRSTR